MEAVALRDGPAELRVLLDKRMGPAFRLARAVLLDDGEAEDAVQEACVIAWQKRSSLRDPDRLDAWFDRIVLNLCRDRLRRRKRIPEIHASDWHEAVRLDASASSNHAPDVDLDAALDRLDYEHRVVVLLRYWRDLTVDDIGERLGVPSGTVKSRLHYALKSMRVYLEEHDGRS